MQVVSLGDNLHEVSDPIFKETICMKCQILFPRKNKKNILSLPSAEFTYSIVLMVRC